MVEKKMSVPPKPAVEALASGTAEAGASISSAAAFPIVALGASAGGLEAFEQFFHSLPVESGMAFVLVQHLDPSHASVLTEIMQRITAMPVVEARDQMVVTPNNVYVIPPNRDMAIFHGVLQLTMPHEPRGLRMPIDGFLRSLAEDQGERAVGVILSGTGTDGTLGLRAIVGAGGIALVQDPATAKYDGMPSSAIRAGYATHVLPVDKMPRALLTGVHSLVRRHDAPPGSVAASAISRTLMLLRSATGHDFSKYKKSTIGRRIERRMSQHNIEDPEVYVRYLKEHPAEVKTLFKELLINVTSFFRDPEAFAVLKADILAPMVAGKTESFVFRGWVAGCATGEEAYSVAMLLRELADGKSTECSVQIYATDLDDDAIAVARAGLYPPNIAQDVSPERLRRFFIKEDAGYRVKKELRDMVVFAVQSVIKDPPFTKLNLLCCRNLMIYLEPELQDRLIPTFHYALKSGGVLFLSPSEGIGNHTGLFAPLSRKWKLYGATHSVASTRAVLASGISWAANINGKASEPLAARTRETNLAELSRRMLIQTFVPASVMTDIHGNILYVHGETGKYLRPAPGQATLNVIEMAREGLRPDLREALRGAGGAAPTLNRLVTVKTNGDMQTVSLSVRPLPNPDASHSRLLLISFQDVAPSVPARSPRARRASATTEARQVEALQQDLAHTRESLQASLEEQQASNEELKSSNEELQSTNEELQSTNEELETSKEELQSLNEELVTVNAELETKIEQMSMMQNDMKNLLDNIHVGTIFLDPKLRIRRFTRDATKIHRLVDSDIGRPLADIKSNLQGDEFLADAEAVLHSLVPCEREVCTSGGTWYLMRTQPYRTVDNAIDGVVLTFTDITERMAAISEHNAREIAESIVDTVREPLVVLDGALKVVSASRSFCQVFRVAREETVGKPIYELGDRQWDIPELRELLETVLPRDRVMEGYMVERDFPGIGHRRMLLNARRIAGKTGNAQLVLLTIADTAAMKA